MNEFTGWLYTACSALCHQLPDRSFFLSNAFLPVCARCTGLYSGTFIGILWIILKNGIRGRYLFNRTFVVFLFLSGLYILIDWGLDSSSNIVRFVNGFVGGWAAALSGFSVLTFFLWKPEEQSIRKFDHWSVFSGIIILSINVVFIILPTLENIAFFTLWTLILFGVVTLFTVTNSVMLVLIFDNVRHRVYHIKHFIQILTAGFMMFIVEFVVVFNF